MSETKDFSRLEAKLRDIEKQISEMEQHPFPDPVVLDQLKHERSVLKDEIGRLGGR
ncbi:YdcH family protein [Halovulum marinum]|nr:YdcH family protein [Halovulum marinum]